MSPYCLTPMLTASTSSVERSLMVFGLANNDAVLFSNDDMFAKLSLF